ncbi:type II secretion system protein C (GspC) [Marinobacter gudaonensis]|uniref:Type II secretion system protein C (GspC) n=1 Tax=Marinobacter gudaonensis TaxID=375760 RepID=A0A1I6GIJ1_9GAMM|nr:type II secretion system protein N [Marinobacter gudaonensis]SFR42015.1 type II secretion system protein C (GspC) [Marinobacter gudaonensis]
MALLSTPAQTRVSRAFANLLLVALVVYLAVFMARISWLIAWDDRPVPQAPTAGSASLAGRSAGQVSSMAVYDFFGRSESPGEVAEAVRRSAPETRLRLRLEGVLVGQRPEDSGAIVAGSNGETAYYRVGDLLPGNAELAEVEPGRVLIRRGGRYESLTFEEQESSELVAEVATESAESSPDAFLANAREQIDSQGVAALAPFGLSPVDQSGASGYVYDGSNPMLNAVNLQAGDVITAINGQRLGDISQDKALLESWRGQAQLDIEIERDGSILTISYAIPEQWR